MKTDLTLRQSIYLRAAELVEKSWWKPSRVPGDYCMAMAVSNAYYAATGSPAFPDNIMSPEDVDEFMKFNDHPDTTAAMVAERLRLKAFE